MAAKYKNCVLGGTFDLLHKGHLALIDKAFISAQTVSIGVNSDKFCQQNDKDAFENQTVRLANLKTYLKSKNLLKRARFHIHDDLTCPVTKDASLDSIIATADTKIGADKLNSQRVKNKLKKLAIIKCPYILAGDRKPISTTRIKNGEISRDGKVYKDLLYKISGRQISQSLRSQLKKPFGRITKIDQKQKGAKNLIAVGDISVSQCLKSGILPHISIVDFYVERKLAFNNLTQLGFGSANADVIVKNEHGQISKTLIDYIEKFIKQSNSSVILVDGEEDLAAIPAILLSKIGSTVVYGQPHKGAVLVDVSTKSKDTLASLIESGK